MAYQCNGFGSGKLGNQVFSASPSGYINSSARVTAISSDGMVLTIDDVNMQASIFGNDFTPGKEILFHATGCLAAATADMGKWCLRYIKSISRNNIVLNKSIASIFASANLANYVCQIVSVPHFYNLTVNNGVNLGCLAYSDSKGGGIVALKCKGKFDISNGKIITRGKGLPIGATHPRKPLGLSIADSQLANQFPMSEGGGIIFIFADDMIVSSNTLLGGNDSGAIIRSLEWRGDSYLNGAGLGGIGGASYANNGAQLLGGVNSGAVGGTGASTLGGTGGQKGYAGGFGNSGTISGGEAGSSIFLSCRSISGFNISLFSTGGVSGTFHNQNAPSGAGGGGGAGFGFIALGRKSAFSFASVVPVHMAYDHSGNLWIGGGQTIQKFVNGVPVFTVSTGSYNVNGLCFDLNDNIWFGSGNGGCVCKVNAGATTVSATINLGINPGGGCCDPSGNIWVATGESGTVAKINPSTNTVIATVTGFNYPVWTCSDSLGNIFVGCGGTTSVYKINVGATTISNTIAAGTAPYHVHVDCNNNIWVANHGSSSVGRIAAGTTSANLIGVGAGPAKITSDSNGNVYVYCDTPNNIYKLSSNGTLLDIVSCISSAMSIVKSPDNNILVAGGSGTYSCYPLGEVYNYATAYALDTLSIIPELPMTSSIICDF